MGTDSLYLMMELNRNHLQEAFRERICAVTKSHVGCLYTPVETDVRKVRK
jgi:hypothetical protein